MKCLTIRQPWAWLIINAPMSMRKPVENRTWYTAIRGEVLIHAGKAITVGEWYGSLATVHDFSPATHAAMVEAIHAIYDQRGCIIGKATLTDCVQSHESPYFTGPYGHVMTNPQRCEPFPLKGQLGYFDVPDDIVSQLKWITP